MSGFSFRDWRVRCHSRCVNGVMAAACWSGSDVKGLRSGGRNGPLWQLGKALCALHCCDGVIRLPDKSNEFGGVFSGKCDWVG